MNKLNLSHSSLYFIKHIEKMAAEIITMEDLANFKKDFFIELRKILNEQTGQITKKWLKSCEVRKLLDISPGTLQNMRINGTLPFTKIGGIMYYDHRDILHMLEKHKQNTQRLGQVFAR